MEYNIYCDESCYMLNDNSDKMGIGCVWCDKDKVKEFSTRIKEIKMKYGYPVNKEVKWTKISNFNKNMYLDLVNFFFDSNINFRIIIINKKDLEHKKFNQTHDDFYYKMYFDMLKNVLDPEETYNIFIDIKDTHSYNKAQELRFVCSNSMYDFNMAIIKKIQPIRSEESQLLQLADILIGASVSNAKEISTSSEARREIINRIKYRSGYNLTRSTLSKERKFNYFLWRANHEF